MRDYNESILSVIVEGVEMESEIAGRYIEQYATEGVGDFAKEKASAIGKLIKNLYEKVIEIIDEVIYKILNFKDKTMIGGLRKKYKDLSMKGDSVKINGRQARLDKILELAKVLDTEFKVEERLDISEINKAEVIVSAIIDEVESNAGFKFDRMDTSQFVNINQVISVVEKTLVLEKKEYVLGKKYFDDMKLFISSDSSNGAVGLLDSCRKLKKRIQGEYKKILKSFAKDMKESEMNSDDKYEAKKDFKLLSKYTFQTYINLIIGLMKSIKIAVNTSAKDVLKAVIKDNGKKAGNGKGKDEENLYQEDKENPSVDLSSTELEDSSLDFQNQLLEAALDI